MKLMINVIGVITVILCTILGLFLIPFFSWLTGFEYLLLFLFIVGCIGLFVTFVGFIRYKRKSCKKVNVLLITLYASLSIIMPTSTLALTKYRDFQVEIDGNLTYSKDNDYYSKFGIRKFGDYDCYHARDTYGQRYYVVGDWDLKDYNIYDCDGNAVGYGTCSRRDYESLQDALRRELKEEYGLYLE